MVPKEAQVAQRFEISHNGRFARPSLDFQPDLLLPCIITYRVGFTLNQRLSKSLYLLKISETMFYSRDQTRT